MDSAAIEVRGPGDDTPHLPLADAVAAAVDDLSPLALDTPRPDVVRVFFSTAADRDAALVTLARRLPPAVRVVPVLVDDENWAARSQADLRAIRAGRVVVAPPWDLPPRDGTSGDLVVEIRPALGFGSGHHPTTRLTLLGLQTLELEGREVLDVGTGSGVLAIAAVGLGAAHATGIDYDRDALDSARASVRANGVGTRVALQVADVATLDRPPVEVLVANITGATLTRLAPVLTRLVVLDGHLVLSGILLEEADAVAAAYRNAADMVWQATEDEWAGMVWRKRAS